MSGEGLGMKKAAPRVVCYTSITFSYLNRARVLSKTLKQFHPDWEMHVFMSDRPPEELDFNVANEPFDKVVYLHDFKELWDEAWVFEHSIVELCTAVKGPYLEHLLSQEWDIAVYLDPDIAVVAPLDGLVDALEDADVLLTPHQLTPEPSDALTAIRDNEIGSLKFGVYNLGFVAATATGQGPEFASWWGDRLRQFCFDDVCGGLFTDQRWCDLAPVFFSELKVLRDPGYNVASWNLSQRTLEFSESGELLVNGSPLKFFHFTKLGALGDSMTERYAGGNVAVYELWSWYKREIDQATDSLIPHRYWHYGNYGDGTPIPAEARSLYRDRRDLKEHFNNPFAVDGDDSFRHWFEREHGVAH
ncbi:MAG: hypothetical protein AAF511_03635 [Pseudomonadota bacterium]